MNTGYLVMNIARHLKYQLNQALVPASLTVQQWAVLQQLQHHSPLTAIELTQRLDMDKPTISGIIKRLSDKDFVAKQANPHDQRSQLLFLTTVGEQAAATGQAISDRVLDAATSALSADEQETLNQLLTKINPPKE